jgi:hypothetical protein
MYIEYTVPFGIREREANCVRPVLLLGVLRVIDVGTASPLGIGERMAKRPTVAVRSTLILNILNTVFR